MPRQQGGQLSGRARGSTAYNRTAYQRRWSNFGSFSNAPNPESENASILLGTMLYFGWGLSTLSIYTTIAIVMIVLPGNLVTESGDIGSRTDPRPDFARSPGGSGPRPCARSSGRPHTQKACLAASPGAPRHRPVRARFHRLFFWTGLQGNTA